MISTVDFPETLTLNSKRYWVIGNFSENEIAWPGLDGIPCGREAEACRGVKEAEQHEPDHVGHQQVGLQKIR